MSFQKVPAEVLEQILQYLKSDKKTISNCLAVCKSWNVPASQICFETLKISVDPKKFLTRLVDQPPERNIGIWVRKLIIEYDNHKLPPHEYFQLLSYLPYLTEVDLTRSYSNDYHFILLPQGSEYLKNLEKITVDTKYYLDEEFKLYFTCAYNFRHSIKHLDLRFNTIYDTDRRSGTFSHFLKDFSNLQSLSLRNTAHRDGSYPNLIMFPILQLCPNLISFTLDNQFQEPEVGNNIMETTGNQRMDQHTRPHLKLETFDLRLPNFTKSHIQYVTSHFPTGLNKFKLIVSSINFGRWFKQNGEIVMDQFGKYLGNVKEVDLDVFNCNRDSVTQLSTQTLHKPASLYMPFAGAIMGENTKLNCHVSVNIDDIKRMPLKDNLRIKRNQHNMYLSYTLDKTDFSDEYASNISNAIQAVIPLHYHGKLALNENKINSIEISAKQYSLTIPACLEILRSMLITYSRVEYIMFSCNFPRNEEYCLKFGSSPSDCELKHYRREHQCYDMHDEIRRKPVTIQTKANLKYVLIYNAILYPSDLITIAKLLPTAEILKIMSCKIEMDLYGNTTIDLQEMHSLKQLVLEVEFLVDSHRRYVVLQVEEMAEPRVSYYYWNAKRDSNGSFLPTNAEFLVRGHLMTSFNSVRVVFIKCQKIEEIVCLRRSILMATLNLGSA